MQLSFIKRNIAAMVLGTGLSVIASMACADAVVVVSAQSKVGNLTADQVSQIFLAKSTTFPNGEQAIPVDLSEGPAKEEFYSKVTGKDASQLKAYWSQLIFTGKGKPPKALADGNEAKKQIAANPNMIGYISKSAVDPSVKVVLTP